MYPSEELEAPSGVESMDKEHAGQLGLLNDRKVAVRSGAEDSVVYALLNELIEHTNLHFLSEQLLMRLHAYQAYESHFHEHQRLLLEVEQLRDQLSGGTTTHKHSLIEALRGWLLIHIQTSDQRLAEYLNKQNARSTDKETSLDKSSV